MHSPRPYGLSVSGGELTDEDLSFIDHEVKKLTSGKAVSGLESIKHVKDLPHGGYVILQDMGGILKAIVFKEKIEQGLEFDGFAKLYVPMLYSGVVTKAMVRKDEGVGLKITEQCRRRLINYSTEMDLPEKELWLQRFIIEPNAQIVPEFISKNIFTDFIATQYVQQRPTWYSGAMAEIVQIAGGYGRQSFKNLPDKSIERAQLKIPHKYIERIIKEVDGVRLPGYSGTPPLDGKIQFNYKFFQTNAITFDSGNQPWLTRISPSGVYAMPLPIVPSTTTAAFREYIEAVGDDEILAILDRFGAMPSGEGFPDGEGFAAWQRAGVVIKVCDCADFYSNMHYSPAVGWSFNLNGIEGFNTCYTYGDDGVAIGNAYKMRLDFLNIENRGWLKKIELPKNHDGRISNYLGRLISLLPKNTHKTNAILYKLRRVSQDDIYQRALTSLYDPLGVISNDIDYWDNLQLEPIASLSGNVSRVAHGKLFHYAKPENQPQIKFPVVEAGGCVSFDFGAYSLIPSSRYPNCNTIMFGYYVGNSLKVVKYFIDWRSYQKQVDSNYEPVMTVGSWEKIETTGNSSPQGHFYTTDFDFREIFSPVVTTTTIKGEDKGFDSQPFFSYDHIWSMSGSLWRNRYYTHLTKSHRSNSEAVALGVCIPYLNRNTLLLAKRKTISSAIKTESLSLGSVRDPTSYRYWTYDFVFAWNNPLSKQTGKPWPVNGNPVWVEIENYNPTLSSDFADQGSWLPNTPYDITWLIHPDVNQWKQGGGGGAPKVKTYSVSTTEPNNTAGAVYLDAFDTPIHVHSNLPQEWYFYVSPDEYGNVFYRDACKVVFGDSEYANISETDQYNRRYKWGYTDLVDHKSAYHFIGVINE